MEESTRAAFRLMADGLWQLEMTLQLHLSSVEGGEPGPISRHQFARLLRDMEKQVGQLHSTIKSLGGGPEPGPNEITMVRRDLPR